jgi:hypothetical protein
VQRLHLWVCHEHEPIVNDHSTCTVLALNYGLLFHRKFHAVEVDRMSTMLAYRDARFGVAVIFFKEGATHHTLDSARELSPERATLPI